MASMEILGCLEPWVYGVLGSSEPWFYGTLGSSWSLGVRNPGTLGSSETPEIRYHSVGALGSSDSIGDWRCQVLVESPDPRVSIWIFGFSLPSGIRYPLVGALGSSDSIGDWRCRVPMGSEDPGVSLVYWGYMRDVWFFRFSA